MSAGATERDTYRVLLIDDDEMMLALARLALTKNGIQVETASTGEDGLRMLADLNPDLVVCDIILPDVSGWELLRRIRESSEVAILMLSGRDSDVDKARGLDLGADDYMTKPFSLLEFEARVRSLLRRGRRFSAAGEGARS
jgi:two-component system, OmpR family, response regulator MprA